MDNVELTTMCAVIDSDSVLMIKRNRNWKGWAFPGGHLENGESITNCIIREVKEETGLVVNNLTYKGFTHFYNPKSGERHIISNYVCTSFNGKNKSSCSEGIIEWINIKEINKLKLAEGMTYRLPLFLENGVRELYIEWNEEDGYTKVRYKEV